MNASRIFPAPRCQAAKRLGKLAGRREELRVEGRALRSQNAADSDTRAQLDVQLRDARARDRAFGDAAARVKEAEKKLAELDVAVATRAEELRVTDDAIAEVAREVERHARQHATALIKEVRDDAEKATAHLVASIEQLAAAHAEWVEVGQRAIELMRITDIDQLRTMRVPDPPAPISELARHAGEYTRGIRLPLLTGPQTVNTEQPRRVVDEAAA